MGKKLIMQGKYKGVASWIGGYGKVTGQWSKLCPSDENYKLGVVGRYWSWRYWAVRGGCSCRTWEAAIPHINSSACALPRALFFPVWILRKGLQVAWSVL